MPTLKNLRIGSRGSKLAVTQTQWVGEELKKKNPGLTVTYTQIKTSGDKDTHSDLTKIGGKGVFVKEIEDALLQNTIDVAVHSLKDVPQMLPSGLQIGPCPKREDPRDAFISRFGELIHELPRGSSIGTSSPRRVNQIRQRFKNRYRIESIRGNVETRLKKVQEGEVDAVLMAMAGLKRLGLESDVTQALDAGDMLPAPCQGCLGLEFRSEDSSILALLETIKDEPSDIMARAERAFLQGLGGSCVIPLAGLATIQEGDLMMRGILMDPNGDRRVEANEKGSLKEPELVGAKLAGQILYNGGSEILMSISDATPTKK